MKLILPLLVPQLRFAQTLPESSRLILFHLSFDSLGRSLSNFRRYFHNLRLSFIFAFIFVPKWLQLLGNIVNDG